MPVVSQVTILEEWFALLPEKPFFSELGQSHVTLFFTSPAENPRQKSRTNLGFWTNKTMCIAKFFSQFFYGFFYLNPIFFLSLVENTSREVTIFEGG